jgi:hypothetical protein
MGVVGFMMSRMWRALRWLRHSKQSHAAGRGRMLHDGCRHAEAYTKAALQHHRTDLRRMQLHG